LGSHRPHCWSASRRTCRRIFRSKRQCHGGRRSRCQHLGRRIPTLVCSATVVCTGPNRARPHARGERPCPSIGSPPAPRAVGVSGACDACLLSLATATHIRPGRAPRTRPGGISRSTGRRTERFGRPFSCAARSWPCPSRLVIRRALTAAVYSHRRRPCRVLPVCTAR
jgi:hypothetical protein